MKKEKEWIKIKGERERVEIKKEKEWIKIKGEREE